MSRYHVQGKVVPGFASDFLRQTALPCQCLTSPLPRKRQCFRTEDEDVNLSGTVLCRMGFSKKRLAASAPCLAVEKKTTVWPCLSTVLYRCFQAPLLPDSRLLYGVPRLPQALAPTSSLYPIAILSICTEFLTAFS